MKSWRKFIHSPFLKKEKEAINDPESLNEIDAKAFASNSNKKGVSARDHIPQIFICATMWHETKEELMEFLKSILRLDEDQCARRMAMKYIQLNKDEIDKDYYDLESKCRAFKRFVNLKLSLPQRTFSLTTLLLETKIYVRVRKQRQ